MPIPAMVDAPTMYHSSRGQSFDNSEPYYGANNLSSKARGLPENSALKPFVPNKEKASNVAKIKVVVCFLLYFSYSNLAGPYLLSNRKEFSSGFWIDTIYSFML